MGKVIAIIVIILAIIGGGWYFSQKNRPDQRPTMNNAPSASSQNAVTPTNSNIVQTNMVSYIDSGFSPKEINIKVGDTVTWTNDNSTKQMWVASAPHPVHTDYPGFDAKQASSQGGTYSFTFQKPGDWKYHNHTNPTDFGIVHVTQ